MIHVLSTGNKDPHPENPISVAVQTHPHRHAIRVDPTRTYGQNLFDLAKGLPPEAVIANVDADDWLAHPLALERVAEAHGAGAWVTYGSYKFADGRSAPWQRAYAPGDVRAQPWLGSHLKTFRAGLVHRLDPRTFDLEHGRDQALMLPLLEMAEGKSVFIAEVLYVYNWGNSFEFNATAEGLTLEARHVQVIRSRMPYPRIEEL